jgi:hypothetical protein
MDDFQMENAYMNANVDSMNFKKSAHHDIFGDFGGGYEQQIQKTMNEVGFQELDKTSEYMETHYYKQKRVGGSHDSTSGTRLVLDYLRHLVQGADGPFLPSSFIDISMRSVPFALSVIDLPFEQAEAYKKSRQPHKFKSDKKRGINITAGGNAILFKKEIKEGKCEIKNDLMMIHRYKHLIEDNKNEEEDMLINQPYKCEIIMTNISPNAKTVNLLCQIPNGSIPLMQTKYVDSN